MEIAISFTLMIRRCKKCTKRIKYITGHFCENRHSSTKCFKIIKQYIENLARRPLKLNTFFFLSLIDLKK